MSVDLVALGNVLRDAAQAEILPRFRRLDAQMVREKSERIDLVTEADEGAERFIAERLRDLMPEALFVGEESVAANPSLLDALKEADFAVVIDPIDGTANFAAGMPLFGVMAAVVSKGETVAALIYDPMGDDWISAEKGAGAWLRRQNGETVRLNMADPIALENMVGIASVGFVPIEHRARILQNLARVRMTASYRCAAHEYWALVSGHLAFSMYYKLMPWDHLAGVLLAQEAGGYAARLLDGKPLMPHHTSGGILTATDPDSWHSLRGEVFNL